MRHLVIAENDCKGIITLGDLHKENRRNDITVQNGRLKCSQKSSCTGSFSAEKYSGELYLRCVDCNPFRTKRGRFYGGIKVPKCECYECKGLQEG